MHFGPCVSHEYMRDTEITNTTQERPKWESAQVTISVPGKEVKESKPPLLAETGSCQNLRKLGIKLGVQQSFTHWSLRKRLCLELRAVCMTEEPSLGTELSPGEGVGEM